MLKKIFNFHSIKNYSLAIIFIFLCLSDFISKIGEVTSSSLIYTSIFFKSFLQLLAIFFIIRDNNKKAILILKNSLILVLIYFIGHFFLITENNFILQSLSNIKFLDWYIYVFILASVHETFKFNLSIKAYQTLFKFFEYFFFVNFFFIIIGFLFDYQIFKCYDSWRYGYNGLIRNVTHTSYISIIYIIYFYYNYKDSKSYINFIKLVSSILVIGFILTKALVLFLVLFLLFIIIENKKWFLLIIFTILVFLFIFFFDYFLELLLKKHFLILYELYHKKGLLTMLFSLRNETFTDVFIPYINQKWSFLNYLFGGVEQGIRRMELEVLDFFSFFGVIGTFVYLYIFNKFVLNYKVINLYPLLILLIIIVILAGSFFSSIPTITYLFILFLYFKKREMLNNFKIS